ncbi:MAG: hydrogen peroxide-inducible genes activator [Hyphomonas sp.]|uniref:hydrogen peroxide-inducible genes activator n=1 Tax=Hyphomonas sp. TaxID=87 RepID=UPI001DB86A3C|nr:hydrogen peroxide-inducible genes activator [Hyphomonas sp.]MBA4225616.1 hydrogen peroxide-inducible genes activator [Hyphomonas sp.]
MRPTLRQMQYLIAIADTGKFGDAARAVNVSQPSLSAQIAEMEAGLGVALVERSRRGAMLTPAGEELVRRARIILREVEDLKAVAKLGRTELSGRLRLGVLPTIGPYLLPQTTGDLRARFPALRLSVREERTVDLDEHLQAGLFDTVISTPEDHPDTEYAHLFTERLYACAPPEDELTQGEGPIRLEHLRGRQLLTLGQGHRLSEITQDLATAAGAAVSSEYEGTSLDAIRLMSQLGAGIAILPSLYALSEAKRDRGLHVRLIDHPMARRDIALIWRETSPLAASLLSLSGCLQNAASKLL